MNSTRMCITPQHARHIVYYHAAAVVPLILDQPPVPWHHLSTPRTLVMPYMVAGCMMVRSGVLTRGVWEPNTAMVLGAYTASSCCTASSNTFCSSPVGMQRQQEEEVEEEEEEPNENAAAAGVRAGAGAEV